MKVRRGIMAVLLGLIVMLMSGSAMAQDGTEDDRACGYVGPLYVCFPPL